MNTQALSDAERGGDCGWRSASSFGSPRSSSRECEEPLLPSADGTDEHHSEDEEAAPKEASNAGNSAEN